MHHASRIIRRANEGLHHPSPEPSDVSVGGLIEDDEQRRGIRATKDVLSYQILSDLYSVPGKWAFIPSAGTKRVSHANTEHHHHHVLGTGPLDSPWT
jgi:hypothetical protein